MLVLVVVPGVHYFLTAENHPQVHACDLSVRGIFSNPSPASPSLVFDCRRQTCAIWWKTSGVARACWVPGRTSTTWSWCAGTSTPSGRHGTASSSPPTRPSRTTNSSAWMKWVEPPLGLFGGKGGGCCGEWGGGGGLGGYGGWGEQDFLKTLIKIFLCLLFSFFCDLRKIGRKKQWCMLLQSHLLFWWHTCMFVCVCVCVCVHAREVCVQQQAGGWGGGGGC